jgi:hypothetical protein
MNENLTNPLLDADLARLAVEIDKLALEDLPRPGLEDRVFAATMPVLQRAASESAGAPSLRLVGTKADARRVTARLNTGTRLAAAFALLVTVGAVWLANRGPVAVRPITNPSDDWAAVTNLFDDGSAKEIEEIAIDTAGLDDRIQNVEDLMLEEGAM